MDTWTGSPYLVRARANGYSFWFGPFIHGKGSDKNDDFFEEMPKSIIPTKGQRGPEIEKFYEDFDLKYTSGRRYCGIYIPTMNTAFDPKSGTLSNWCSVTRSLIGSNVSPLVDPLTLAAWVWKLYLAEDLYQRYVFRERLGSVLTMGVIELILRVVSFILILAVSRKWDHASCWILIFTSLMDTG